jgi:hypothetical protein
MQAEIHRARREMRAGETIRFDPRGKSMEEAEAAAIRDARDLVILYCSADLRY